MSVTQQTETIITEYKQFNVQEYGNELKNQLDNEMKTLADVKKTNTDESNAKIDGYATLHDEHKDLQKENTDAHKSRQANFDTLIEENNSYAQFATEANNEHAGLRDDIANKENPLRVLENEVKLLDLDNKNLQLVIDTENELRNAKAQAELSAVTTANTDLKDLTQRLESNIQEEGNKKGEAEKILKELQGNFFKILSFKQFGF